MKLAIVLVPLLLVACGESPEPASSCTDPTACACGADRMRADGTCCPAWTVPTAGGQCAVRSFTLPSAGETWGGDGARRVAVSLDGHGRAIAVWDEALETSVDKLVVAEERTDGGFSLRTPAAALAGLSSLPVVIAGQAGDAVVAWRQWQPDHASIHVSERSPEGTWRDPASDADRFSFGDQAYEPRLGTRPAGETVLVWNQWYQGSHFGVALARKAMPGAAWQRPASEDDVLSAPIFFSNAPQIALNAAGDGLVCWYQSSGKELMAYVSERHGADGVFSRPGIDTFVSAKGAPIDSDPVANPKPALSPDGRAAVAWTQETGTGAVSLYLATRDAAGTWTPPKSLADSLSRQVGEARDARVAFGPLGELYVVWSQDEGAGAVVHLAERDPKGAWVFPGQEPLELSTRGAEAINPVIAVGPGGGVLVAWSERVGDSFRVAARRGSGTFWLPLEVLSPPGADALGVAVAVGGAGDRAVVGWSQGEPQVARAMFAFVE
jgi:hypothetical protein